MTLQNIRQKGAAAAAVVGLGALLVGCSRDGVNAAQLAGTMAGAPLAVSCEPNQRAVVRQVAVNGAFQSQVQCETVVPSAYAAGAMNGSFGATPVAYAPGGYQQVAYAPVAPLDNTRLVRAAYPQETVVTGTAPRRVVTQRAERVVSAEALGEEERGNHRVVRGRRRRHRRGGRRQEGCGHRRPHRRRRRRTLGPDDAP